MIVDGKIVPQPVVVGSKYNGHMQGALNHGTGDFWVFMGRGAMYGDERMIQRALCRKDMPPPHKHQLITTSTVTTWLMGAIVN